MRRVASRTALFPVLLLVLASSLPLSLAVAENPSGLGPQSLVVVTAEFADLKPEYYPPLSQA